MHSKLRQALSLVMAAMLCLMAGCGSEKTAEDPGQLVKYQRVGEADSANSGKYAGTVRGRYESNLSFQVAGQILSRNVQLGQKVSAGDVLMVIDAKDVVQKANQTDAQVDSAKAQLNLAQKNLSRYQQLYAENAVSAAVLDQYQSSYDAAAAAYQNAVAQSIQGHNALGYTNLVAEADGVISAINAEAGQVVAAGQTVVTLVQAGELEVEIQVPENKLSTISVGKEVGVSFWALPGKSVRGIVREVAPMANASSRTYKVRVSLPNPPEGMELGMTASVSISEITDSSTGKTGSEIPLTALYQTGDEPQVWVVDEDTMTVSLKTVTVENLGENSAYVSGLKDGEAIVTAGVHKLRDGQKVRFSEGDGL